MQVALHDYRGTRCTLKGTPSVTLLGAAGTPLATHEGTYLPTAFDGQADVDRLVLLNSSTTGGITGRASGWASFTFAYNGPGPLDEPTTACPTTSAIAVGLPSASGTVVVRAALRVFGPESATSVVCGSISVGSLYAGLGPQT